MQQLSLPESAGKDEDPFLEGLDTSVNNDTNEYAVTSSQELEDETVSLPVIGTLWVAVHTSGTVDEMMGLNCNLK